MSKRKLEEFRCVGGKCHSVLLLFMAGFFYDFIEHYVFQKRMYSSKIGMPIWYIMLAFMQENM